MKLNIAAISICILIFTLVPADAQSIAEERAPQASPDTAPVDRAIKEKLESASPEAGPPSFSKALPAWSHSRTHQRHRSHKHRTS
jgi:hypothetical protein